MGINDQCNPNSPATSIFPSSLVIYSGASNHMTFVDHHLNDSKPYTGTNQIVAITLYTPQIQNPLSCQMFTLCLICQLIYILLQNELVMATQFTLFHMVV